MEEDHKISVAGTYDAGMALSRTSDGGVVVSIKPRWIPDKIKVTGRSALMNSSIPAGSPFGEYAPLRKNTDVIEHLRDAPVSLDCRPLHRWVEAFRNFNEGLTGQLRAESESPRQSGKGSESGLDMDLRELVPRFVKLLSTELVIWESGTRQWRAELLAQRVSRTLLPKLRRHPTLHDQGMALDASLVNRTMAWYTAVHKDVLTLVKLVFGHKTCESYSTASRGLGASYQTLADELRQVNAKCATLNDDFTSGRATYITEFMSLEVLSAEELSQRKVDFDHLELRWDEDGFHDALTEYLQRISDESGEFSLRNFLDQDRARHLELLSRPSKRSARPQDPTQTKTGRTKTGRKAKPDSQVLQIANKATYVFGGLSNETVLQAVEESGTGCSVRRNSEEDTEGFELVQDRKTSILSAEQRWLMNEKDNRDIGIGVSAARDAVDTIHTASVGVKSTRNDARNSGAFAPFVDTVTAATTFVQGQDDSPKESSTSGSPEGSTEKPQLYERSQQQTELERELQREAEQRSILAGKLTRDLIESLAVTDEPLAARMSRLGRSREIVGGRNIEEYNEALKLLPIPCGSSFSSSIARAERFPRDSRFLSGSWWDGSMTEEQVLAQAKLHLTGLADVLNTPPEGCHSTAGPRGDLS